MLRLAYCVIQASGLFRIIAPTASFIVRFAMLNVRFIRHGESLANVGGMTGEPHMIPLTLKGRQQAEAISRTFDNAPGLIISSPYLRARDTAAKTMARFPDVPLEIWPVQEIEMLATDRRFGTTSHERRPLIEAYWSKGDPDFIDGDGAESYRQFAGRARETLMRLTRLAGYQDITVFSHEQFMKGVLLEIADPLHAINRQAMRAFYQFHHEIRIANAEGFSISWNGRQWSRVWSGDGFDANTGTE